MLKLKRRHCRARTDHIVCKTTVHFVNNMKYIKNIKQYSH